MHSDRSHLSVGLPHSEIRGSQPSYRLLSAYRRFSRPSSPLNAKASIMCPFSLGHAYLTPSGGRCMPRPDFADPEHRSRVSLLTRIGDSNTRDRSRFSIAAPPVAALAWPKPCDANVSGALDQHFTCQRVPTALAIGDRQWYRSPPCRQGGEVPPHEEILRNC